MVGVVVVDHRPRGARAAALEPPPRAREAGKRGGRLRRLDPGLAAGGDRRERVQHVVLARHALLHLDTEGREVGPARAEADAFRGNVAG